MVDAGRSKLPHASWHLGQVEDILPAIGKVHLIIAGQAYQWFDRPAFLAAAKCALSGSGHLAVIQNNRDHANSAMLSAYEDLLEQKSPGYSRRYRVIDIQREIAEGLGLDPDDVGVFTAEWTQTMPVDDFVGMSSSSTQVQRAMQAAGDCVLNDVRELASRYGRDGQVQVPYRTELFVAHL